MRKSQTIVFVMVGFLNKFAVVLEEFPKIAFILCIERYYLWIFKHFFAIYGYILFILCITTPKYMFPSIDSLTLDSISRQMVTINTSRILISYFAHISKD